MIKPRVMLDFLPTESAESVDTQDVISFHITRSFYIPAETAEVVIKCDKFLYICNEISVFCNNMRIFRGFVDSQQTYFGPDGIYAKIYARSLASKLLDTQARPATYNYPDTSLIALKHITPYGLTCNITEKTYTQDGGELTIRAGTSEWDVIRRFLEGCDLGSPYVDMNGQVLAYKPDFYDYEIISNSLKDAIHYTSVLAKHKTSHLISEYQIFNAETGLPIGAAVDDFCEDNGITRVHYNSFYPSVSDMKVSEFASKLHRQHLDDSEFIFTMPVNSILHIGQSLNFAEEKYRKTTNLFITDIEYILDENGYYSKITAIPTDKCL